MGWLYLVAPRSHRIGHDERAHVDSAEVDRSADLVRLSVSASGGGGGLGEGYVEQQPRLPQSAPSPAIPHTGNPLLLLPPSPPPPRPPPPTCPPALPLQPSPVPTPPPPSSSPSPSQPVPIPPLAPAPSGSEICARLGTDELRAIRGKRCPNGWQPFHGAGVNVFDALWDGSSQRTGGDFDATLHALQGLKAAGIRYFRFFASLYGGAQWKWVKDPSAYWRMFDRLMEAIEAAGLYVIPSIGYDCWVTITDGANNYNDFVFDAHSQSRGYARRYFLELVARYRQRHCVLLWELGNELNLLANLPPPHCHPHRNCFDTQALVSVTRDLVHLIRVADPTRPISSGFAYPRAQAWHMEHCRDRRDGPCTRGFWSLDTREQSIKMIMWQNEAVDVVSVHIYDARQCYFAPGCERTTALVEAAAVAAKRMGKWMFLGEYGGPNPDFTGPSMQSQHFPIAALQMQVEAAHAGGAFRLSAIWAWECPSHRKDMNCIWPSSQRRGEEGSDRMLHVLREADQRMRQDQGWDANRL